MHCHPLLTFREYTKRPLLNMHIGRKPSFIGFFWFFNCFVTCIFFKQIQFSKIFPIPESLQNSYHLHCLCSSLILIFKKSSRSDQLSYSSQRHALAYAVVLILFSVDEIHPPLRGMTHTMSRHHLNPTEAVFCWLRWDFAGALASHWASAQEWFFTKYYFYILTSHLLFGLLLRYLEKSLHRSAYSNYRFFSCLAILNFTTH